MIKHSDSLKQKEGFISEYRSLTPELFNFYMEIFLAQEESAPEYENLLKGKNFFQYDISPALIIDNISFHDELKNELYGLLKKLTAIISKTNKGMNFALLLDSFGNDADFIISKLLKLEFVDLENRCRKYNLAIDEFIFVIHNLFKPMLIELRNQSKMDFAKDEYFENKCPFCGYLPNISKIVESKDNKLYLHCSICENDWSFPRLTCPTCGSTEQSKHGYFEFEDNSLYRAYYCDDCKYYVKSIKISKVNEDSNYDLAVEDIITNFIDATMIDKGYKRI
ncbi:MAG: formate dehydrogenase accessory protein FdhE [Leptospirales bacterium]|nr:formate dehydrogenase accessory protein FdhE [Leptospirales bacterium]